MAQNFSPSYTTAMLLLRQLADRPDLVQGVSAQNLKILGQPFFLDNVTAQCLSSGHGIDTFRVSGLYCYAST